MQQRTSVRLNQAEESVNSKMDHLKLSKKDEWEKKNNEKEWRKTRGFIGHYWENQYTHYMSPRRNRDRQMGRNLFKEMMAKNFPN